MMYESERLDRIERILLHTAGRQQRRAQVVHRRDTELRQLTEKIDRTTERIRVLLPMPEQGW
jgi:hypothetical protein